MNNWKNCEVHKSGKSVCVERVFLHSQLRACKKDVSSKVPWKKIEEIYDSLQHSNLNNIGPF